MADAGRAAIDSGVGGGRTRRGDRRSVGTCFSHSVIRVPRCRLGLLAAAAAVLTTPAPGAGPRPRAVVGALQARHVSIVSMPRLVSRGIADQRPPHLMELLRAVGGGSRCPCGPSDPAPTSVRATSALRAGNRARADRNRAGDAVDAGEQMGPDAAPPSTTPSPGTTPPIRVLSLAIEDARADAARRLLAAGPAPWGRAHGGRRPVCWVHRQRRQQSAHQIKATRANALAMIDAEGHVGAGTILRGTSPSVIPPAREAGAWTPAAVLRTAFDAAWSGTQPLEQHRAHGGVRPRARRALRIYPDEPGAARGPWRVRLCSNPNAMLRAAERFKFFTERPRRSSWPGPRPAATAG